MRLSRSALLPVTPATVSDARALISRPDLAAGASENLRRLAWLVAASARGRAIPQRRRAADNAGDR